MKGEEPIEESRVPQYPIPPVGGRGASATSLQVADFSQVINIFQLFSRFFTPFLSCKGLVSRRLRQNGGLIKSQIKNAESNFLRKLRFHEVLKGGRRNLNLAKVCRL
jgi:hypothetical protein